MSTAERTELIINLFLNCTYTFIFYLRPHGRMQLNPGIAPVSLHLPEVIGHDNNYPN